METLFGQEELQTLDLHSLDVPPNLKEFFGGLSASGHLRDFLHHLIVAGVANDFREAIGFLRETYDRINPKRLRIVLADFQKPTYIHRLIRLFVQKASQDVSANSPFQWQGSRAHEGIANLLTGSLMLAPRRPFQQTLFSDPWEHASNLPQQTLFGLAEPAEVAMANGVRPIHENWPDDSRLGEIQDYWQKMAEEMRGRSWSEQFLRQVQALAELCQLLDPYFGPSIRRLRTNRDPVSQYLTGYTIMSWASVLLYLCKSSPRFIFAEVPILPWRMGLSGGRVDALEVVAINGRPPNAQESRVLRYLTQSHFRSVSHLYVELVRIFGPEVEIHLLDWKLPVGDGGLCRILTPADVSTPPARHDRQIRRYLTLAAAAEHLSGASRQAEWQECSLGALGVLVYPMSTTELVEHRLEMSPDERLDFFSTHIVARWPRAQAQAGWRELSRVVTASLKTSANNGTKKDRVASSTLRLISEDELPDPTVARLISRAKRYADQAEILEVRGRRQDGRPKLALRGDRFLLGLQSGRIGVGQNLLPDRCIVSCLMDDHEDSTPSMIVNVRGGYFHCFGCGASGAIDQETLPEEWEIEPRAKVSRSGARHLQSIVIPEATDRIMTAAQEMLRQAFLGSEGERYLLEKRRILPEVAQAYGVGFANDTLTHGLLDSGFSLDDLAEHGFVGFSWKVSSTGGITPLLRRRRMRLKDIKREARVPGSKSTTFGFPYSVLAGRLTFPLTFWGKHTNFYARAVRGTDRRLAHRKLTKKAGLPQGGFNMEVLTGDHEEIILLEGAIDALTLAVLGFPNVVAVIGASNDLVLEEVARSGKNIALASDNDDTGWKTIHRLMAKLQQLDFRGGVRDFTGEFIAGHYGFGRCKDFNQWWTSGYRL